MSARSNNSKYERGDFANSARRAAGALGGLPEDALASIAELALRRVAEAGIAPSGAASDRDIEAFCAELVAEEPEAAGAFVDDLLDQGRSVRDIYLIFIPKAARLLGELWDEDALSIFDVTVATARLQALVHALSQPQAMPLPGRRAIFASVPGETHSLGIRIATNLFRDDGWDIELLVGLEHEELVARIADAEVPLIGLSAGGSHALPALNALILAIRLERPEAKIVVCGQIVGNERSGVDAALPDDQAADFEPAKEVFERLISLEKDGG